MQTQALNFEACIDIIQHNSYEEVIKKSSAKISTSQTVNLVQGSRIPFYNLSLVVPKDCSLFQHQRCLFLTVNNAEENNVAISFLSPVKYDGRNILQYIENDVVSSNLSILTQRPHKLFSDPNLNVEVVSQLYVIKDENVPNIPGNGHYRYLGMFEKVIGMIRTLGFVDAKPSVPVQTSGITETNENVELPSLPSAPGRSATITKRKTLTSASPSISNSQGTSRTTLNISDNINSSLLNLSMILANLSTLTNLSNSTLPVICGNFSFCAPLGWGQIIFPTDFLAPHVGGTTLCFKNSTSVVASTCIILNPLRPCLTPLSEAMNEFITQAHTGFTSMTKSQPQVMNPNSICGGNAKNLEALMHHFVLRAHGKTHYRVYVFLKQENQVQSLIYYTNGLSVYNQYFKEFSKMLESCEPAAKMLSEAAAVASAPPQAMPAFPRTTLKKELPQIPIDNLQINYSDENSPVISEKKSPSVATPIQQFGSSVDPNRDFFASRGAKDALEGLYHGSIMGASRINPKTKKGENCWIVVYLLLTIDKKCCLGLPRGGKLSQFQSSDIPSFINATRSIQGDYEIAGDGDDLSVTFLDPNNSIGNIGYPSKNPLTITISDDEMLVCGRKEFTTISGLKLCRVRSIPLITGARSRGGGDKDWYKSCTFISGRYYSEKLPTSFVTFHEDGTILIEDAQLLRHFSCTDTKNWNYCIWHFTLEVRNNVDKKDFTIFCLGDPLHEEDAQGKDIKKFSLDGSIFVRKDI
ncbi:hypothetical protein HDU92_002119 [Lobulomyces angularis]|nr:hypothetical protein HDU92_002119 [Lobulomyces angularis]